MCNDTDAEKKKSEKCEEHRTISLISHASKVLTKIVSRRIENRIQENATKDRFELRRNRETRKAILCLRLITEKNVQY